MPRMFPRMMLVMGVLLMVVRVVMGFVVIFRMSFVMGFVVIIVVGFVMGLMVIFVMGFMAPVRPAVSIVAERRFADRHNQNYAYKGHQNVTCDDHNTPLGKIVRLAADPSRPAKPYENIAYSGTVR